MPGVLLGGTRNIFPTAYGSRGVVLCLGLYFVDLQGIHCSRNPESGLGFRV